MMTSTGWRVESGTPCKDILGAQDEVLRWQDPACSLSVSRIGALEDGFYRLRVGADLIADIWSDGRIVTRADPRISQSSVDHFLSDMVFPRLLAHAGTFVVHAGAVRVGDAAVMLMGNSGRGKSTLTTSFDNAAFAMLGDDAMIISSLDATPRVRPVYPSLRLFPDSIEALMPGAVTAGPARHYSTKQRIDVPLAPDAEDWPLPVSGIFAIAEPADDDQIAVRQLTVAETCMFLVESSFALDPADRTQARHRLEDASCLARQVPAFEISYPRDYARLPEVRQAILDQVAALKPA